MAYKRPWLAALLNFLFPSLGYFYLGRRKPFAYILLISFLFAIIDKYLLKNASFQGYSSLGLISGFLILFAFSIDAYLEANAIIKDKKVKPKKKK